MEVLLGFLTGIAAQLFKLTYLNRTEPEAPATKVLRLGIINYTPLLPSFPREMKRK